MEVHNDAMVVASVAQAPGTEVTSLGAISAECKQEAVRLVTEQHDYTLCLPR
jgi:hypothetical protein